MAITIRGDRLRYDFTVDAQRYNGTIDEMRVSDFPNEKAAKKAAREWEAKRKTEIQDQAAAKKQNLSLSEALERMYRERWRGNDTGETSRQQIESIIRILGDRPLKEITNDTIADLRVKLQENRDLDPNDPGNEQRLNRKRTEATLNRYLAALRALLRRACIVWEQVPKVPLIELGKETGGEMVVLSPDAQKYLLRACNADYRDLFTVLAECGMRASELLNATAADLDNDGEYAMLRVPANKEGDPDKLVPLSPIAYEILERRAQERGEGRFFDVDRYAAYRYLQRAKKRAKELAERDKVRIRLDGLNLHSFRHTTATRLARATRDPHIVQAQLNHASITTSLRYIHYVKADAAKALHKLSDELNKQPESPSPTV